MQWLMNLFEQYNEISKGNPIAGLILVPIVAAIVTAIVFYLKNVPKLIWMFIQRNTIVTLTMNNTGYDGNEVAYEMFDRWFSKSKHIKHSRNFFLLRTYFSAREHKYDHYRVGIGNGLHFFMFMGRLYWFVKSDLPSSGSERQKEQIVVRTFGLSGDCFKEMIQFFNNRKIDKSKVDIHSYQVGNGWNAASSVRYKDLSKLCIDNNKLYSILNSIENFTNHRDDYLEKGLTHKISFLFHGPAGTGKTSLAKALAGYFTRDIYILDLSRMTNAALASALREVEPGSIVLIEDVDQAGNAVKDRTKRNESGHEIVMSLSEEMGGLTMSGVLNALDGVVSLDNIILMFTSNHPELLDPAIRRKSRIDHEVLIDYMGGTQVFDYIKLMYGTEVFNDPVFKKTFDEGMFKLPGCDAEAAYKENKDSPIGFLNDIIAASKKY